MSEHVDMEWSEVTLFLLEFGKRDPSDEVMSCFGEETRRGALPNGSGGREQVGDTETPCMPLTLKLRLLAVGMGMLKLGEHPRGTNIQWETSSSKSKVDKYRFVSTVCVIILHMN